MTYVPGRSEMAKAAKVIRVPELRGGIARWAGKCVACGEWNTMIEEADGRRRLGAAVSQGARGRG